MATQATALKSLTNAQVIALVGPLCTEDMCANGILASITMAQFILESSYGKSELAQNANNLFAMKESLSGNSWEGSTWDGESIYTKETTEQNDDGTYTTVTATFRKYDSIEDSIADHSAYLAGAKSGKSLRYDGISGCTNYEDAANILADGGYATSSTYASTLCKLIEKWNLTKFDADVDYVDRTASGMTDADCPFLVSVSITNLNIRKGPGTDYDKTGKYTGKGTFTIVKVKTGKGSTLGWGKLKSGAGWISLDYCEKVE